MESSQQIPSWELSHSERTGFWSKSDISHPWRWYPGRVPAKPHLAAWAALPVSLSSNQYR